MIDAATFKRYAASPAAFRDDLIVDVSGRARRFGDVMDPWQREDFAAVDPGLQRCNGRQPPFPTDVSMRVYLERARGHSKTFDLAVIAVWALAFAARPIRGYCFAADKDQAKLLRDAMETVIRLNPWLADILRVDRDSVVNIAAGHPGNEGRLDISTSDVGSSFGILPDIIVADELVHWPTNADGLWHSLISSAAKRTNCLLAVITNAGFIDSWQWQIREAARTDPAWTFSHLEGSVASWIDTKALDEQRRMLPPVAFSRLWENVWSSSGGDALLPSDIAAAFDDSLQPMTGNEEGWLFVGGVDLGLTRDASAVVVLAFPSGGRAGRVRLAAHKIWHPTPGRKVDLLSVELHLLRLDKQFGLETIAFDPWQAELLAARLESSTEHRRRNQGRRYSFRPWMHEVQPVAANLREQASITIEYFGDRRLQLYNCEPLRRDLLKLRAEEKSYGIRLTSPRDEHGHGDTFSAFALALMIGHELAGHRPVKAGAVCIGPGSRLPRSDTLSQPPRSELAELRQREQDEYITDAEDDRREWAKIMRLMGR